MKKQHKQQKQQSRQIFGCTAGACAALFCASSSLAGLISYSDLPNGQNNVSIAGLVGGSVDVNVVSFDNNFQRKTVAGVSAVGVAGGSVSGEIDGAQYIEFNFSAPVNVTSLSVAHLYTKGNHGDNWNEQALFSTDVGDFYLEASGATSGLWSGYGLLSNDSPAVEGGGGAWTLAGENIFGSAISTLRLSAGNAGPNSRFGDFGFVGMQAAAIPVPGAIGVLGMAALAGVSRRRKA